jgi:hypothetical protein
VGNPTKPYTGTQGLGHYSSVSDRIQGLVGRLTQRLPSGDSGTLEQTEIDTAYFKGNFPDSCTMHAICSNEVRVFFLVWFRL